VGKLAAQRADGCGAKQVEKMPEAELALLNGPKDAARQRGLSALFDRLPPHTLRATTAGRRACSARQLVARWPRARRNVKTEGIDCGDAPRTGATREEPG
jgi:hypothetical protein